MLSKRVKTKVLSPDIAAGVTTQTFTTQDTAGFRGIRCIVHLGDVTATAVITLRAYQGLASDGSDKALLSGTSALAAAVGDATEDDKILVLDIRKPMERYITFELVRATANVAVNSVIVEFYDPRDEPITDDATVLNSTCLTEPSEA